MKKPITIEMCQITYPDPRNPNGAARCPRQVFCKGLCYSHYRRTQRGIDPHSPLQERRVGHRLAKLDGTFIEQDAFDEMQAECDATGKSMYALTKEILEHWAALRKKKNSRVRGGLSVAVGH